MLVESDFAWLSLTCMATIHDRLANLGISPYELPAWEARMPIRPLYVVPALESWVAGTAALHIKAAGGRTPAEHLQQLFCDLRCARRPGAGELRRVMPTSRGVWKLHPPHLRIFGWAPERNCFVAVCGDHEAAIKRDPTLYDAMRDRVLDFVKQKQLSAHVYRGDIRDLFD